MLLAQCLNKPGCLGNAVTHLLPQLVTNLNLVQLHCAIYLANRRVIQQNSPAKLLLSAVSNTRFFPKYSKIFTLAPPTPIACNRAAQWDPTLYANAMPINPPINTPLYWQLPSFARWYLP